MKRFSTRWLVIGAILAILLLIANVTVTYRNTRELYQTGVLVAHTHDVLIALDNVLSLVKDAETGQRGYIITGEESYLHPYTTAVSSINRQVDDLAAMTADYPRQQARMPELRARIAAKLAELNRTITLRQSSGYEAARAVVSSDQGKVEMEAIRSIVGEMIADETNLRKERLAIRDKAFRAAVSEGLFSGIFAIAAVVAFLVLLRRFLAERERSTFIIAEQSERLRTTLASIGDGVIATDADGLVTTMNAVAEALTGWNTKEASGVPLTQVLHIVNESTRAEVENPALRALKEGVIVGLTNHTILIAKDGTERPIDDSAAPIRNTDGEIIGSVLVFRDISERYRAEAEQRESRQQLATTLESVKDGFIRYDRDWQIVYVNSEAERINELTRSEMLGKTPWELFPAVVGTTLESEFRRAVAEQVTVEFENHYEPFGRWYSLKGYPTADGGLTTFIRDITAQKESENALRASEERLAFVRLSSGVGFWYCDLPFDVLQWDDLVKAHFHLPPDALVTIETFYERIHPDDREATREAIERSIANRTSYNTDYRTVNPETRAVTWVRAIGRTFYAADGTPTRFDGVTLDVSDQKRAEDEVIRVAAESERQRRLYETVLTNTPDFVYVFSLDHKVVYANESLIEMWGRGYEGAIGKTFLEIGYEPWHAEMHDREIDQVAATKQPIRGEVPFTGTSGTRQYDYIFVPVIGADGEVEAVAGTTRDVTDRKEAEKRLRTSEEQLAFAVAAADLGQWSLNLADHTASRTPRHDQIFGYDSLLPEWTYEMFLDHVVPDDREAVDAEFQKSVATGSAWAVECRIRRADGAVRHVWTKALIRRDADGQVEWMLGIVGDVTERRQAEERQAYLVRLADTLRPISDAIEVQATASRILGEHLRANRVVYFEIRGDDYVIERDYFMGVRSLVGRYPVAAFGSTELTALLEGRTVIEKDARAEPNRSDHERAAFASIQVRGHVDVPLVKDGRFVAGMTVQDSDPREWTNQEIALIEETAERTWAAVERVRAEAALRQSEERLRMALKAARMVAWEYNPASGAVVTSENATDVYGFPEGEGMGTIDRGFAMLHPDDVHRHQATVAKAVAAGEGFNSQFRIIRPDNGNVQWMEEWGHAVQQGADKTVGLVGVNMDITARKAAEERLRASEKRFRVLFETMSEGFAVDEIIFDEFGRGCDLRYLEVNPAFERHTGLKRSDILGRTLREMFPGAETLWFERYGEVVTSGIPAHFQAQFGPLERWFEVSAYKTGPTQFATVFFDITERIRAEETKLELLKELETQNAFFQAVLTQVPAAIVVSDAATGHIVISNEEAHRIVKHEYHVGKRLEDYGNNYIVEAFATDGSRYGGGRWPLDRALAGETVVGEEIENVMFDQSHVFVRVNAGPIRVAGEVVAAVAAFHDITNYKNAEAEIKALSDYNRNVLESIADPLFTVDRAWRFTYVSMAGEQLLGYGPGEIIGKHLWEEFPGVVGSGFETPYRQAMEGIPGRVTAYYPDHKRWYEANMFPALDGITVYFRNVTDRIRYEQNLAFLADLLKDFTPISTVEGIISLGALRIAEYLKLSHCILAEIDEAANEAVIVYDHHDEESLDLVGKYALDEFLERDSEIPRLAAGSVILVNDVYDEPRSHEAAARFKALGIQALVCAPYVTENTGMFLLAACHSEPYNWSEGEIQLLQELAARVCLSIERARAEEKLTQARDELEIRVKERTAELAEANVELQARADERLHAQEERVRLLGQIISSQEDERHRIARDMHDDLGQRLTALRLHLETLGEVGDDNAANRKLAELKEIAKDLDSDLSLIVWRLRPAALDNVGLVTALADYIAKWSASFKINVEFQSAEFDDSTLSTEIQTCLYRITQEGLNNVYKYAEAETVSVILDRRGPDVTLIIEDNGKGFELSEDKDGRKGFGLIGMHERAALVGGVVEIESTIGKGTSIFVRIPIIHLN